MDASYHMMKDTLGMFLFLGIELSALFILISSGVSLLQQYIPNSKIQAILSCSKGRGYILAAILGAITPFCSCSTIPMLRGLLKAKAGFGPTLTFLFTSPLLNPIIIGLFIATFGIKVTVIYTLLALCISIISAFMLDKMHYEQYVIPENKTYSKKSYPCCQSNASLLQTNQDKSDLDSKKESACCSSEIPSYKACCGPTLQPIQPVTSCCGSVQEKTSASCCSSSLPSKIPSRFGKKLVLACREGWSQYKQVFPYLFVGVALGAFVYGFVPSEFIATYASGDNFLAVPIAAVIGIPLYVRAEALIPLSSVLVSKGMGLGAVMSLIIGGSGASLTELILLKSMFRMPMIIAFLVVILGMAIFSGYFFQFLL